MFFRVQKAQGFDRPIGPFWPNWVSPQASGLIGWWATQNGIFRNMRTGGLTPWRGVGATTTPSRPVLAPSAFGLVAQSDNQINPNGIVFDTGGPPGILDGLTAFTISYWNFWQESAAQGGSVWGQGDASSSTFCETTGVGGSIGPFLRNVGDFRGAFSDQVVQNTWQHVTWTWESSVALTYYNNGVSHGSTGSGSGTIGAASGNGFFIGGQQAGSGGDSAGSYALWADVRVYLRILTDSEVWHLYDPSTRWDLYWQPSSRVFFLPSAPPSVTTGRSYFL